MIKLRNYQKDCLNSIIAKAKKGKCKLVAVLATGTGKTIIFSKLVSAMKAGGGKSLILVHREELINQAKDKLQLVDKSLKVEIEQGVRKIQKADYDVVVGSVQTLGRKGSKRILKFQPNEFKLIIIDECERKDTFVSCEKGYKKIQDITIGTNVWTYNEKSKKIELKPVLKVIKR